MSGDHVEDLGDVALVPGFVNAHTHFELSYLADRIPTDRGFTPWLENLVRTLRTDAHAQPMVRQAVQSAVRQSLAAGVTTIGDIARLPSVVGPVLAATPLRGVLFAEVVGIGKLRADFLSKLEAATNGVVATDRLRVGLSPHAPYTVEPVDLRRCASHAGRIGLPLCIHVAETPDEEAFTTTGDGPLREYLERLGVWDDAVPCPRLRPVDLLAICGLLGPRTLLAHANYVSDDDIRQIAQAGAGVAYCPRTHAAFGHAPHRFRDMLAAGVCVCVGTDSLASNPSLSVLDELRHLHRVHPDVPPPVLLAMATRHGAQALGLDAVVGALEPGKDADFVAVPIADDGPADPIANVLSSTLPPLRTYVRGGPVVL